MNTVTVERNIKDYLHLYLGCRVILKFDEALFEGSNFEEGNWPLTADMLHQFEHDKSMNLKPILRPLSDMTLEEMLECGNMIYDFSNDEELNKWQWKDFEIGLAPEQFYWLLSKHFDLFGLIESGLAISTTKPLTP